MKEKLIEIAREIFDEFTEFNSHTIIAGENGIEVEVEYNYDSEGSDEYDETGYAGSYLTTSENITIPYSVFKDDDEEQQFGDKLWEFLESIEVCC